MGYIYLLTICDGESELFKIGITKGSVLKRLKQLQTGCPHKISIQHIYESVNYKLVEKWLHGRYNIHRTSANNEWFYISNEDVLHFLKICQKGDEIVTLMLKENVFFSKRY